MKLPIEVIDSHIHFFLSSPISNPEKWAGRIPRKHLERMRERFEQSLQDREQPTIDMTLETPADYARRWEEDFDAHGLDAGIFLSLDEDLEDLGRFVSKHPGRFIPYGFVDPLDPKAPEKLSAQVRDHGIRGLKLISTNQWFHPYDENIYPLYERACELGIPILIHCGVSIGYNADFRYANPLDLQPVLRDFPDLNFILAHFGAGFFREALLLCYQSRNIYLDTSSSNIWMKYQGYQMEIRDVLRAALECAGPERIIFGTDSSYFPRGFRRDIFDAQYQALCELGVPDAEMSLIFSGNIKRLTGL